MPEQPDGLRVMAFNIRYRMAPDGALGWTHRKESVAARIRQFAPDLLGVQECADDSQAAYLRRHLPGYALLGVRRGAPGSGDIEMAPLLYRAEAFELLDWGVLWLSQTPDDPGSLSWGPAPRWSKQTWLGGSLEQGASLPRTLTWARLRSITPPQAELAFINTHLDHASRLARWRGAGLLRRFICQAFPAMPAILTGDFNCGRDSAVHRYLLAGSRKHTGWLDAHQESGYPASLPGSFHDFGRLESALDIDWILVSPHFMVVDAGVDTAAGNASDHYPVWAVLRWG